MMQRRHVQLCSKQYINLDARDQQPPGQLNLSRCFVLGVAPRGSCLSPDNKGDSHFLLSLNRWPVKRHTLTETCAAPPCWRVLRLAAAKDRRYFPAGQERENVRALRTYGSQVRCKLRSLDADGVARAGLLSAEPCSFLFCFHFMSGTMHCPKYTRCMAQQAFIATSKPLYFFLVGVLLFSALFFSFTHLTKLYYYE